VDVNSKKEKLFHRDSARCQCCSKKLTLHSMTLGHRVAKAIAKSDELANLQLECFQCNADKSKLNKEYMKNSRKFRKNGGNLAVQIHPITYARIERENNLDWFIKHNFLLEENEDIMIGDFAVL